MMHVEALQWLNCIFTCRLRANCHQLYELGNAKCKWEKLAVKDTKQIVIALCSLCDSSGLSALLGSTPFGVEVSHFMF